MKMMPPDVISHENQLQHLSEPSIFMLDVFRTADHAGQIFIPHRPCLPSLAPSGTRTNSKAYSTLSNLTLWQPDLNLPSGPPGHRPIYGCAVYRNLCSCKIEMCN